mmetsp:Transcript_5173/g.12212  ORF Transcript_5173/g.12212 Transcript_5173/m.12212 type:complete len:309 (-) Transcript_5173:473-1399(-)
MSRQIPDVHGASISSITALVTLSAKSCSAVAVWALCDNKATPLVDRTRRNSVKANALTFFVHAEIWAWSCSEKNKALDLPAYKVSGAVELSLEVSTEHAVTSAGDLDTPRRTGSSDVSPCTLSVACSSLLATRASTLSSGSMVGSAVAPGCAWRTKRWQNCRRDSWRSERSAPVNPATMAELSWLSRRWHTRWTEAAAQTSVAAAACPSSSHNGFTFPASASASSMVFTVFNARPADLVHIPMTSPSASFRFTSVPFVAPPSFGATSRHRPNLVRGSASNAGCDLAWACRCSASVSQSTVASSWASGF